MVEHPHYGYPLRIILRSLTQTWVSNWTYTRTCWCTDYINSMASSSYALNEMLDIVIGYAVGFIFNPSGKQVIISLSFSFYVSNKYSTTNNHENIVLYWIFILDAISSYTTGLKALFEPIRLNKVQSKLSSDLHSPN